MTEMISTAISKHFQDLKKTLPLSQFNQYRVSKAFEKGIYRRQAEGRCRNCGWPGHWEWECGEPCGKCQDSGHRVSQCRNEVFCFYCEEEGHFKGTCPRKRHH
ncbi:hypothetical protein V8F44DRAFT_632990 [Aspergillus fumigatus]